MKLPDFIHNNFFKNIRKKMDIEDEYIVDIDSKIEFKKLELDSAQFEQIERGTGLDISLDDLDIGEDNTIVYKKYKDRNVILYIRDQYSYKSQYKYHVSWCKTLKEMRNNNKLNRYVISRRTDGTFHVNMMDTMTHKVIEENIIRELSICKNCLNEINYKGYNEYGANKNNIYSTFSIQEFLEKYDSRFNQLPKYTDTTAPINQYASNWKQLSFKYRTYKNWTCANCGLDCKNNKGYLDVHHIDSNKSNNDFSNLKAVCKDCHANEYGHGHYKNLLKNRK